MARIRFIHWDAAQGPARVVLLRGAGHAVTVAEDLHKSQAAGISAEQPALVLIDLTRLPSHGREVALSLRRSGRTRGIPIAFVGGAPEKVARVRAELPDAAFLAWEEMPDALAGALAAAPKKPLVPRPRPPATGAPLVKKLGIRSGMRVALLDAPWHFEDLLGELPPDVTLVEGAPAGDLVLWFVRDAEALETEVVERFRRAGAGTVWIAWQKGAKGPAAVRAQLVWEAGRAAGRGAGKLCGLDAIWSAMQFGAPRAKPHEDDEDFLGFDPAALRREDGRDPAEAKARKKSGA